MTQNDLTELDKKVTTSLYKIEHLLEKHFIYNPFNRVNSYLERPESGISQIKLFQYIFFFNAYYNKVSLPMVEYLIEKGKIYNPELANESQKILLLLNNLKNLITNTMKPEIFGKLRVSKTSLKWFENKYRVIFFNNTTHTKCIKGLFSEVLILNENLIEFLNHIISDRGHVKFIKKEFNMHLRNNIYQYDIDSLIHIIADEHGKTELDFEHFKNKNFPYWENSLNSSYLSENDFKQKLRFLIESSMGPEENSESHYQSDKDNSLKESGWDFVTWLARR